MNGPNGSGVLRTVLVLAVPWTLACSPGGTESGPVAGLVEAERAFAADATERGVPEAFLAVLAEDGVVFVPEPVPGRPRYEAMPRDLPARLEWEPRVAEASAGGDLGFTTGPYTLRLDGAAEASHGHYFSVWRRDGNGPWRLRLDIGTPHDPVPPEPYDFRDRRGSPGRAGDDGDTGTLREVDASSGAPEFADLGPAEWCRAVAAPDVRFHHPGRPPAVGAETACAARAMLPAGLRAVGTDAEVSGRGDLGVTHGTLFRPGSTGDSATHVYARVWRHQPDGWFLVAEVVLPLPPAAPDEPTPDP